MSCFAEYGFWSPNKRRRRLPQHRNAGLELILISKGTAEWEVEGRVEGVRAGDLFFTLPWQRHGGAHARELNLELAFVVIRTRHAYTSKPALTEWPEALGLDPAITRQLHDSLANRRRHAWPASPLLAYLIPQLVTSLGKKRDSLTARGLALAALGELANLVAEPAPNQKLPPSKNRVRSFLDQLPTCCEEDWTLDSMAAACGLHRTQFSSLVQELTGDPPRWMLNRYRIERARRLLSSAWSVTDTAFACGFQSSQYFATVFRAFHGQSPSQFQAAAQTIEQTSA